MFRLIGTDAMASKSKKKTIIAKRQIARNLKPKTKTPVKQGDVSLNAHHVLMNNVQ
jgi:hypothetical protein